MGSTNQVVPRGQVWAGRIVTGVVVAFLVLDGAIKVLKLSFAVAATVQLGYPAGLVLGIGLVELASTALYALPGTSILGAILLTAYLGGATATKVRLEDPWYWFSVGFGVLVWAALYLRDGRLRGLIPFRRRAAGVL